MVLKSFYDAYYFFFITDGKRVLSHENGAKKRGNNRKMERFTTNLENVNRKLVAKIKLYHTLIWYQHSILYNV